MALPMRWPTDTRRLGGFVWGAGVVLLLAAASLLFVTVGWGPGLLLVLLVGAVTASLHALVSHDVRARVADVFTLLGLLAIFAGPALLGSLPGLDPPALSLPHLAAPLTIFAAAALAAGSLPWMDETR